jgi:hypothetical protein
MQSRTAIRYSFYLLATLLVLFALWCLLWIISSSSMAFTACVDAWELFAENPRCRQPSIAGLLALASTICAVAAVFIGQRYRS